MEIKTDPEIENAWKPLGDIKPVDLIDARLNAHWAAQIVSTAARTHLEHRADDSHTNLGWIEDLGVLASREVGGHRAALRVADLTLQLLDGSDQAVAEVALEGHTLDDGYSWLQGVLSQHAGLDGDLKRPDYDMPEHTVQSGGSFAVDAAALAELSRWYSNASLVLQKVASWEPKATEIRCWPHHFDIATLILEDDGDPEEVPSIGLGMSPGNPDYSEPYWYCSPYPRPKYLERPMLHGEGFWHDEGWFGAILLGTRLISASPLDAQARRNELFVRSAISGSRILMKAKFAKL